MQLDGPQAAQGAPEGRAQQTLGIGNACMLAGNFIGAGFDVVVLDVHFGETTPLYEKKPGGRLQIYEHHLRLGPCGERIDTTRTSRPMGRRR